MHQDIYGTCPADSVTETGFVDRPNTPTVLGAARDQVVMSIVLLGTNSDWRDRLPVIERKTPLKAEHIPMVRAWMQHHLEEHQKALEALAEWEAVLATYE